MEFRPWFFRSANIFIRDHGAIPSFFKYGWFPHQIVISVNDAVVHGFPKNMPLKEGDLVSVDVGAYKNGFHGDQAYTFILGEVPEETLNLVKVTKESLGKGIEQAIHGNRIGDIGHAIQSHVDYHGYGVVRELVGHGLGKKLHEKPHDIPNYGRPRAEEHTSEVQSTMHTTYAVFGLKIKHTNT